MTNSPTYKFEFPKPKLENSPRRGRDTIREQKVICVSTYAVVNFVIQTFKSYHLRSNFTLGVNYANDKSH